MDGKKRILQELLAKYNSMESDKLNEKMSLGQKIKSARLELDRNFTV